MAETSPIKINASGTGSPYDLTAEAKRLCQDLVIRGPSVFHEKGWNKGERRAFLESAGVQMEIERLTALLSQKGSIQERAAFFAQVKLHDAVPMALNVLLRRLAGPSVKKLPNGKTEKSYDDLPDDSQYAAALEVLNRTGVGRTLVSDDLTAPVIHDKRSVNVTNVTIGGDDAEGTTSRERVRAGIEQLLHSIDLARTEQRGIKRVRSRVVEKTPPALEPPE